MKRLGLLLAVFCAAAAAPLGAAVQDESAEQRSLAEVPKSFRDCTAAFRGTMDEAESEKPFGCTRAYLDSLPESGGSTYDMGMATARAAEAGDLYIDSVLVPEIVEALEPTPDQGPRRLTRDFLLRSYVRSARAAGETLCDLYYDYHSEGTIRSVVAGSCAVSNRDRLIGDLLGLAGSVGGE